MVPHWPGRVVLGCLAALLLPALPVAAPAPGPDHAPAASLRGQLLIAAPDMGDPRFRETVVLMVRHDESGAFGLVINRPFEERTIASLLTAIGRSDDTVVGSVKIFAGGPVEPGAGFVVHSGDYRRADTIAIDGKLAVTSDPEVLRDIGHGKGPAKALFAIGYAGWGPGQLEGEMARRDWFTTPADANLVFDDDRARVWDHAMARRTRDL
jgi:putative transcriptional regulator